MSESPSYLDLDLAVTLRDGQLEVRVLDSPAGETGGVQSALGEDDSGAALFDVLFPREVLARYRESRRRAQAAGAGLRIVLRFAGGADQLPWERVSDPETRSALALDPSTPIIRCTEMPHRSSPARVEGALHVLLVVSTPPDLPKLDAAEEVKRVTAALREVMVGAATTVQVLENATLDDLRHAATNSGCHVLHYIGHGSRQADGSTRLELTGPDGLVDSRPAEEVAAVLAGSPTLRLAVLNCCHSSASSPEDPFAGVAAALVKAGVPAVVAMRRAVSDRAAVAFAAELYRALAAGIRLEAAVAGTRSVLLATGRPDRAEWSTVALHLGSSLDADLTLSPFPRVDADVQFSVGRPERLRAGVWAPMLVLAHHGEPFVNGSGDSVDQSGEVGLRIAAFFGEAQPHVATTAASSQALPRGAVLVVQPDLPGVDCNPPQAPLPWSGEISEATFLLRAASQVGGDTVSGWVRVFCGPLVIAEAAVEFGVDGTTSSAPPGRLDQPVLRYSNIYPCFAADDLDLVESVVGVAEALGDRYLSGAMADRRSGAPSEWMRARISEADSFQLFWSRNAMTSPGCRAEWEAAAATGRDDFIRPLYWQDPFPTAEGLPPPALASLRFVKLPAQARSTVDTLWDQRTAPAPPAPYPDTYPTPSPPAPRPRPAPSPGPYPDAYPAPLPAAPTPYPAPWPSQRSDPRMRKRRTGGWSPWLGVMAGLIVMAFSLFNLLTLKSMPVLWSGLFVALLFGLGPAVTIGSLGLLVAGWFRRR